MRYPKGSIVLSDSLDVPALRKVYQAGHVSACQLYRALHPVFEENKWKSFVRRLGLLSQRDFLLRMVVEGMSMPVFALGDEGARSHALRARTDFCGPQAGQLLSQKQVLGRQRRPRTCGEGNQSDQVDGNQGQRPQATASKLTGLDMDRPGSHVTRPALAARMKFLRTTARSWKAWTLRTTRRFRDEERG